MTSLSRKLYDEVLILRCQAGDEAALAELIALFSPRVRFFLKRLAGEAVADDLLQEVWFDVYRKLRRLERAAAFSAWLYRIARDKAYRELRRRRPTVQDFIDQNLADVPAVPEGDFSPEDAKQIRTALDDLPAEQREVLLLRFVEDLSYEQIAEVIARPVGTVRSRIHYARLALKRILERRTLPEELKS